MENIYSNISGTTSDKFSIGKRGTSVISGTVIPNNNIGVDGDLYVLKSSTPKIYQKNETWVEIGTKHIQTITDSETIVCKFPVEVILCDASTPITITLSTQHSSSGHTVIVKDISNSASSNTITITSNSLELFDNGSSITIGSNMGTLELLYDGTNFYKI